MKTQQEQIAIASDEEDDEETFEGRLEENIKQQIHERIVDILAQTYLMEPFRNFYI